MSKMEQLVELMARLSQSANTLAKVNEEVGRIVYEVNQLLMSANNASPTQAFNTAPQVPMQQQTTKVRVALWEKERCFNGVVRFDQLEFDIVLFNSNPNSNNLIKNGFILPKGAQKPVNGTFNDISVGSAFVNIVQHNGQQSIVLSVNMIESPAINGVKFSATLMANPNKTKDSSPAIIAECEIPGSLLKAAMQEQINAATSQQQQQYQPGTPADAGLSLLTNGGSNINQMLASQSPQMQNTMQTMQQHNPMQTTQTQQMQPQNNGGFDFLSSM